MSISSRSYARPYGSRGGLPRGIQTLLIANTALFLILYFGRASLAPLFNLLALTPADVVRSLYVWQLGTFLFVHGGNILGFLFNMLALWMFGRELEEMWGTPRFVRFYFLCGSGAGACVIVAQYLFGNPGVPAMGSTPAIYGILAASAVLWPEREVIFFFFPMKMKYFVILIAAVDFLLSYEAGIGAIVLLLAGLLIGVLYIQAPHTRRRVDPVASLTASYKAWKLRRAKRKFQVYLRKHGSDRDRFVN
jgi:membrane associated rhomboid family serine protease